MIEIYVVYEKPIDYPDTNFVMRLHRLTGNGKTRKVTATSRVWTGASLADVTQYVPAGKQRHDRSQADPPHLIEWWH